jgi:hypothetical protein
VPIVQNPTPYTTPQQIQEAAPDIPITPVPVVPPAVVDMPTQASNAPIVPNAGLPQSYIPMHVVQQDGYIGIPLITGNTCTGVPIDMYAGRSIQVVLEQIIGKNFAREGDNITECLPEELSLLAFEITQSGGVYNRNENGEYIQVSLNQNEYPNIDNVKPYETIYVPWEVIKNGLARHGYTPLSLEELAANYTPTPTSSAPSVSDVPTSAPAQTAENNHGGLGDIINTIVTGITDLLNGDSNTETNNDSNNVYQPTQIPTQISTQLPPSTPVVIYPMIPIQSQTSDAIIDTKGEYYLPVDPAKAIRIGENNTNCTQAKGIVPYIAWLLHDYTQKNNTQKDNGCISLFEDSMRLAQEIVARNETYIISQDGKNLIQASDPIQGIYVPASALLEAAKAIATPTPQN